MLSLNVIAIDDNAKIATSYELASMTLGAQWVVPTPSHVYINQSGECTGCYPYYMNYWLTESYDAGWSRFRSYLKIRSYRDEPGCSLPRLCTSRHSRTFLTINSKELRKQHAKSMQKDKAAFDLFDIYNYCLQTTPALLYFREPDGKWMDSQVPATMVFCFSEMPVPEPLVVYTRSDYLGDHDCGVYPPRSTERKETGSLSDLDFLYLNLFPEQSDASRLKNNEIIRQAVNIQFLSGGITYRQLVVVSSGRALLEELPVRENTIIVLRPQNSVPVEATASGSGLGPATWIKEEPVFGPGPKDFFLTYKFRLRSARRLNQTESYPENLGHRDAGLQISSQDVSDYLSHHAPESQQAEIDFARAGTPAPALMIIGQGEGVRLDIDADLPGLRALFHIRGPVQLYNIDLNARLLTDSYLFQVDHYLQMYRTSIHLNTPGKLFAGNGLVSASRSVLEESPVLFHEEHEEHEEHEKQEDDSLLIRACRSDIHLNDWQVTPEQLIAVNKNYSYFEDFLNRAEQFLPQKPLGYPDNTFDNSPLWCSKITSQGLVATNRYSQLAYFPQELRGIICPDADTPAPYTRAFDGEQPGLPANRWETDATATVMPTGILLPSCDSSILAGNAEAACVSPEVDAAVIMVCACALVVVGVFTIGLTSFLVFFYDRPI